MIAYVFPPLGGIAAQRVVKFTRYLPEFGWHPIILSTRNSPFRLLDEGLEAQVPLDTPVFRALTLEPEHLYNLYRHFKVKRPSSVVADEAATSQPSRIKQSSLLARLQSWLFIPDGYIGWFPFALALGQRLLKTEQLAAIFSTSTPYTAHLIAKNLAERSGLPWIMDLRDPWVDNHFLSTPTRWHYNLTKRLERNCVQRADRVVCVTPPMTEELRQRYPDQPADKFLTITNGFDSADFDPAPPPDPHHFSIRHVGTMYGGRSVIPFLQGLALALGREPGLKKVLQVEFIGDMDQPNLRAWDSFITTHQLHSWISRSSFVPHHQAIKLMQQSQVQLLILGAGAGMDRIYTGKLFEYLAARRPILALAPPGIAATLLQKLEAGLVIHSEEPSAIAQAILEFYSWFQQGRLHNWSPHEGVEAFERRHLTQQLACSLDDILIERGPRSV